MIHFNEGRVTAQTQLRHTNDTGEPEPVLSPEQTADLARLLARLTNEDEDK